MCFFRAVEHESFALIALAELGDIVQTEHHVLRRHSDRFAIGRVKNIVRLQHQHLCFHHRLVAERQVHSHLVAVEVGVKRRTCERVQLDSLTFDEFGLESLDTQAVQCWCTVEEHGMSLHHIFEDVPHHGFLAVDNLFGALHRFHDATLNEFANHERFVELCSHIFRDTAFAHFQFRTYHDNGTC